MSAIRKISIALTEELASEVENAVASGDYASTSEVIRAALRDWKTERARREAEIAGVRRLWQEGLASGEPRPLTDDWFAGIRRRARAQLGDGDR